MLNKLLFVAAMGVVLSACGHIDEYEAQVHDWDPVYCYKSLAATSCYQAPKDRDKLRLVNYFGPHPSRYDVPEMPERRAPVAPEMINYWVKDAEPLPRPAPHGDLADRPWLTPEGRAQQQAASELMALHSDETGTLAFLRLIEDTRAQALVLPAPDLEVR